MIVVDKVPRLNHPIEDGSDLDFTGPDLFTQEQVDGFIARMEDGETINFDEERAKLQKDGEEA